MHLQEKESRRERTPNLGPYSDNLRPFHPVPFETEESVFPKAISHPSDFLKRSLDIIGACVGLILFGMTLPIIGYKIRKESPGPILFKQPRTGKDSSVFQCYKLRTMHLNNPDRNNGQPVITTVGDPRIFEFGHFLRRTNLDEFPQLINVLLGDMSLVGPRPFAVAECQHWEEIIPNWSVRYIVKPGITGWAQVTGYRGGTLDIDSMNQRLLRDFKYIETASFWLDLLIIWKTVTQMVQRKTSAH
jgi:putative colanic acid biosysnthesis UDP-glucose lipid carrier transferase